MALEDLRSASRPELVAGSDPDLPDDLRPST
jgi:hypothetical protein